MAALQPIATCSISSGGRGPWREARDRSQFLTTNSSWQGIFKHAPQLGAWEKSVQLGATRTEWQMADTALMLTTGSTQGLGRLILDAPSFRIQLNLKTAVETTNHEPLAIHQSINPPMTSLPRFQERL